MLSLGLSVGGSLCPLVSHPGAALLGAGGEHKWGPCPGSCIPRERAPRFGSVRAATGVSEPAGHEPTAMPRSPPVPTSLCSPLHRPGWERSGGMARSGTAQGGTTRGRAGWHEVAGDSVGRQGVAQGGRAQRSVARGGRAPGSVAGAEVCVCEMAPPYSAAAAAAHGRARSVALGATGSLLGWQLPCRAAPAVWGLWGSHGRPTCPPPLPSKLPGSLGHSCCAGGRGSAIWPQRAAGKNSKCCCTPGGRRVSFCPGRWQGHLKGKGGGGAGTPRLRWPGWSRGGCILKGAVS